VPYQLSWYRENQVVLAAVSGNFSLEELQAYSNDLTTQYLDLATAPIHIISDAREMGTFPTQALPTIRSSESWLRHPNLGWAILVGKHGNPILGFILALVTKVVKLKYKLAPTPEAALSMLCNIDPVLSPVES
jgi:hypothetical protein